ncbi:MAG: SDR family oxidoreductase [Woeseiaceae bacterium]|nr:SDR family oxidoreductase [Woeseiaceae bacterium]
MKHSVRSLFRASLAALAGAVLFFGAATTSLADGHGSESTGQTVLITGANRGLGLEFARQYAADGWTVIGTARRPASAEELAALDVEIMQLDVTDRESIAALAASLDGRSIDMLINNAGIFPRVSEIDNVDADDYMQTLAVNTLGPVLVTQAVMPNLREGELKQIVNITSGLASIERNSGGFYGYRESKAALNMFTSTLANELGDDGFICLALHPGWVRTDMGGANANLSPEESVSGMRAVIDGLTAEHNGRYFGYDGSEVAW